jgi:hypothetical protein
MAITEADVQELRAAAAALPPDYDSGLGGLTTTEILAYTIHAARLQHLDEVECIELLARAVGLYRDDLRAARAVLKPLGYTAVADLLTRLARRAKPRPPRFECQTESARFVIARRRAEREKAAADAAAKKATS